MTSSASASQPIELWAGMECTLNRIGNHYSDQLERSGHFRREGDLERLAQLGIRTIRYPILWERTAPDSLSGINWSWADSRMAECRGLGLRPIVGLLHHGSGPRYATLVDPEFPEMLAEYASHVARRYPWVSDYTPVNEPLTTARFSCLYGHWYPHGRDPLMFARATLAECRGIILSMREVRAVNSAARLIQTEDIGKTFSTPKLAYQSDFENERRWLTFDLLTGRLVKGAPMWDYFRWLGVQTEELEWFADNPVNPDVLGVNYYVTGERFLDERITRYPAALHGGNGQHSYADVEAVRARPQGLAGAEVILKEVWQRYGLPIAVTEAHLGCTREEQLRWLDEVWSAALILRNEGVDLKAVTTWSAFGAFDWNSLLTRNDGCYEPGMFDLRSAEPRPTALSRMVKMLASAAEFDHPVLDTAGWWRRLDRLCYPPVTVRDRDVSQSVKTTAAAGGSCRALVITGATGTLGQAFARICKQRGLAYHLLSRSQLDIADQISIEAAIDQYEPWAIINTAGFVRVDDAEVESDRCFRENLWGPTRLAIACAERRLPLVTFSSDLVFNGLKGKPYVESDTPSPINMYGQSKARAEASVADVFPEALVIRTSSFFGPWDHFNFVHGVLDTLSKGRIFVATNDITISPTYVPDLVNATLDLLIDGEKGIWHLTNSGMATWAEFARMVARKAGYEPSRVYLQSHNSLRLRANRPGFTPLSSERANLMPPLETSLASYFQTRNWAAPQFALQSHAESKVGNAIVLAPA